MDAIDKALFEQYPNMSMGPGELLKLEHMRDIGDAQKAYTRAVTEITAAQ
jgi:spermidine/putrescine transport system substrate-binding protein